MPHSSPARTRAGAVLPLAALALAAGAPAASAAPSEQFYVPPASIPQSNGALIKQEPGKPSVGGAASSTRIMYTTTDANGTKTAVTGTVLEPKAAWTGSGQRPLVSYAVGTQGQGDACAPSKSIEDTFALASGQVVAGYEAIGISGLLNRGIAVVVTDYIGLGTPGVHTYVDRLDQGHAVLDSLRAALNVGGSFSSRSPMGLFGYSQGGGASGSAAELASQYAPELNLKGAYVGAPPADLAAVTKSADGSLLVGVLGYAVNSLVARNPQLKPVLDAETNADGKRVLAEAAEQCIGNSAVGFAFQKSSKWTTSGETLSQIIDRIPEVRAVVDKQRIGRSKPTMPVNVLTGTQDDIVDHAQAKTLALDWCRQGANVTYTPVRQLLPSFGTGANHALPLLTELGKSQDWLTDRLNGRSTSSNCLTARFMP